jgi:hypothetical protein
VIVHLTEHGGHLGYIGRAGVDRDLRWMDWRIVDWATAQLAPVKNVAQPVDRARPHVAVDSVAGSSN